MERDGERWGGMERDGERGREREREGERKGYAQYTITVGVYVLTLSPVTLSCQIHLRSNNKKHVRGVAGL